jgi:hypothetical protein
MMNRIRTALFAASAALVLSGCATDNFGYGGRMGMGYGPGVFAGDPYWGWHDNFFYPGTGYYVYDRGGARHRWSNNHRRYWEARRGGRSVQPNWQGYGPTNNMPWRAQRRGVVRPGVVAPPREIRREAWQAQRQQRAVTQERAARREAWRAQRQQQGVSGEGRRQGNWGRGGGPRSGEGRGRGGGRGRN